MRKNHFKNGDTIRTNNVLSDELYIGHMDPPSVSDSWHREKNLGTTVLHSHCELRRRKLLRENALDPEELSQNDFIK